MREEDDMIFENIINNFLEFQVFRFNKRSLNDKISEIINILLKFGFIYVHIFKAQSVFFLLSWLTHFLLRN